MQLWVIHEAKHLTCTCLDCCFIFPSAMRAFWNACLTEIDPVVPTHCCLPLSIMQLPPVSSLLSFPFLCSSSAAALFGIPPPLLSYHLPAFFFSSSTSNEGSPPTLPVLPPTPPLAACVCLFHVGWRRGKLRCFVPGDTALSLPALILYNRKRTRYSQFNYWQFCLLDVCADWRTFACICFLIVFVSFIRMSLFNSLLFLCRHERFEKAFLLAVDLEARDLFMVSVTWTSFKLLS